MVQSEPGRGTTFHIYLPQAQGAEQEQIVSASPAAVGGNETILLVEDEESVRELVRDTLAAKGYALLCLGITLVGLPVVTCFRAFRRMPEEVQARGEVLDLAVEPGLERVVGEGKHRWLLLLPGNRSLRVSKGDCELTLPGLPRALDGLSLVQVTDTHFSHCYRREFFEIVAEEAARWDVDLVAFTGDLDFTVRDSLRARLSELGDGDPAIVDLSQVEYMDSLALAELVLLHRARQNSGRPAPRVVVGDKIARLYEISGIGLILPPYRSVAEAQEG